MATAVKSQVYNREEIYDDCFDDDDKIAFDNYLIQSRILYPNLDEYIMKLAITAHINKERGRGIPLDEDEALRLREQYLSNIKGVYETPQRDDVIISNTNIVEEEK